MLQLVFNFLELEAYMDNFLPFILEISLIIVGHAFFFLTLEENKETEIKEFMRR